MSKQNAFKSWMEAASVQEQEDLAEFLETSRNVLYQYSGEFRSMSPSRARMVEEFTLRLHKDTKGRLPKVYRTDVNTDCRGCDFAHRCLGAAAVVSEFPYVAEEPTMPAA